MNTNVDMREVLHGPVQVIYEVHRDKTHTVCRFSSLADNVAEAMRTFTKTYLGLEAEARPAQMSGLASVEVALFISGGFDAAYLDLIVRRHLASFGLIGARREVSVTVDSL
jgi:hypothetical protein